MKEPKFEKVPNESGTLLAKSPSQHSTRAVSVLMIGAVSLTKTERRVVVMMGQAYERSPESGSSGFITPADIFGKSCLKLNSR